jgi:hypothetical protein
MTSARRAVLPVRLGVQLGPEGVAAQVTSALGLQEVWFGVPGAHLRPDRSEQLTGRMAAAQQIARFSAQGAAEPTGEPGHGVEVPAGWLSAVTSVGILGCAFLVRIAPTFRSRGCPGSVPA